MGEEHSKHAADRKARAIRDRALELLADASLHAERIHAAAEKLGITPDLLDGIGDHLYEAAVAQLDVASKILERSQLIADRLFDLVAGRLEPSRLMRIDVDGDKPASLRFVVRNASARPAQVSVEVTWDGPGELAAQIGRRELPADRETWIEIPMPRHRLDPGKVYTGCARAWLIYDERSTEERREEVREEQVREERRSKARAIEQPRRDFEIWVSRSD